MQMRFLFERRRRRSLGLRETSRVNHTLLQSKTAARVHVSFRGRPYRGLQERPTLPDRLGEERDAPAVIAGARIAQVDDLDQRVDRGDVLRDSAVDSAACWSAMRRAGFGHRFEARAAQRDQVAGQARRTRPDRPACPGTPSAALERFALQFFFDCGR